MILSDKLHLIKRILIKSKKEWLQIILFSLLVVFILSAMSAFCSNKRFDKIMLNDSLDIHRAQIYGTVEENKELIKSVAQIEGITKVVKSYETYTGARINSKVMDCYSIPSEVDYFPKKLTELKEGEIIVSKDTTIEIDGKKRKGKSLIGKEVNVTTRDNKGIKVKIVDIIDPKDLGLYIDTAFLSNKDINKIADIQKEKNDEYTPSEYRVYAKIN